MAEDVTRTSKRAPRGRPDDYRVIGNTGHVVTVYASTEDGELVDFPQNIVVGEFDDGSVFEICIVAPCDTNLIRDWEAIDPALRSIYGLDESYDDLVLIVSYDRDQLPNAHNVVAASNLPSGVTPPAGAVTCFEWYRRDLGLVAITDVDAATGGLTEFYKLIDYYVGVPDQSQPPAVATLAIYDLAGRLVRALESEGPGSAGTHSATWDGCDAFGRPQPSGTYVCRLQAGPETYARRLSLIR